LIINSGKGILTVAAISQSGIPKKKESSMKSLAAFLMVLSFLPGFSQNGLGQAARGDEKATRIVNSIDRYLSGFFGSHEPGGVVLASRGDEIIFRKAYGMANMELGVAMKPEMVFMIGSLSKQFAAVAVMMLKEKGLLLLDDKLSKYFPDYAYGDKVRIEHLLSHTSGIKDYLTIEAFADHLRDDMTNDDTLKIVFREGLEFSPGDQYSYSNSNYAILGSLVEKLTGVDYSAFIDKVMNGSFGLKSVHLADNDRIIAGMVTGYEFRDDRLSKARLLSLSHLHAAGGLCASADDLLKWNNLLVAGKVISKESLDLCVTPFRLNSGAKGDAGFGWFVDKIYRRKCVDHGGGIYGFVNHTLYIPEEKLYVAVLRNYIKRATDTRYIAESVAGIILGEYAPPQKTSGFSMTDDEMRKFVGDYKFEDGSIRKIMLVEGKLFYGLDRDRKAQIEPASETVFYQGGGKVQIEFFIDENGIVTGLRATTAGKSKVGYKVGS
jgi:CubicO group peptidase (beta-lactamase class C family)